MRDICRLVYELERDTTMIQLLLLLLLLLPAKPSEVINLIFCQEDLCKRWVLALTVPQTGVIRGSVACCMADKDAEHAEAQAFISHLLEHI